MGKVELLAPAGDFSCFMAAVNAGADAVYLGGEKFGARAYANNFTTQEIIEALRIAHLFQKKVYVTVNTLVKDRELKELIPFMEPLVEAKLDGVIVQDLGVLISLREAFTNLELHASTQMTITGKYGARFLKKLGATRIVPARELSLEEIRHIKEDTGLEIETFIHGAMCYAYSGQCLFSSLLGGRSGNRGRCAGPCRLPYEVKGKTMYPLSLKDMYTLSMVPELMDAGIDSFKIEGRMKSPEYVAGVTSMYRKYIDAHDDGKIISEREKKEDEDFLRKLYIRSDICNGYYHQHNHKSMVTIQEPGYSGCEEASLKKIRDTFLSSKKTLDIQGFARVMLGEPITFRLTYKNLSVEVEGKEPGIATNRPVTAVDLQDRLSKTGNTCFTFSDLKVQTDEKCFVPVKELNELRRMACEQLEQKILSSVEDKHFSYEAIPTREKKDGLTKGLGVFVQTLDQLMTCVSYKNVSLVYIQSDLLIPKDVRQQVLSMISVQPDKKFYLAFPHILRERSYEYLESLANQLKQDVFSGVLCRNMETYEWLMEQGYEGEIIADYSIYSWNTASYELLDSLFDRTTIPLELNKKEMFRFGKHHRELVVYGRIALMYSANCVQKTLSQCVNNQTGSYPVFYMKDRQRNPIPVLQNCFHCYNILYNPVVMSLHNQLEQIKQEAIDVYRLEFTLEGKEETKQILDFYAGLASFPIEQYTAGHYNRGVE